MRRLTHWFAAVCLTMAGTTAQAQDNPVVVELFTSQGCSSCPPADSVLAELGTHDDVIPLALHVDYWDYIGWPDLGCAVSSAVQGRSIKKKRHALVYALQSPGLDPGHAGCARCSSKN